MTKENNYNEELISLNKFISSSGICSRREADKYIEQGRVTVNNKKANKTTKVLAADIVALDGERVKSAQKNKTIYIALNKPVGITSTTNLKDRTNIISFINYPKRIFPIGRLDKDSDGLILLTNNGDIVNKILRAGNYHEKEYIVTVNKAVTTDFVQQMSNGVPILGTTTQKCFVRKEGNRKFRITLTQGMNRQIRRMCQHFGYKVISLTRVRIMNIQLDKLPVGKWRLLTQQEVEELNSLVASSVTTEDASVPKQKKVVSKKSKPSPQPSSKKSNRSNKSYKEYRRKNK